MNRLFSTLFLSFSIAATAQLYAAIWWTGEGETDNWSDADNWFDGETNRLPTDTDTVYLGYAGTEGNPVSNTAQNIVLDTSPTVFRINLYNAGERSVSITAESDQKLNFAGNTTELIIVQASAQSDAYIDVPISASGGTNTSFYLQNASSSAVLNLGSNFNGTFARIVGSGNFRISGTLNGEMRFDSSPTITLDGGNLNAQVNSLSTFKIASDSTISVLQAFGATAPTKATFEREGEGDRVITINAFTVQTEGNQAGSNYSNNKYEIIADPGNDSHLTIRVNQWRTPTNGGPGLTPYLLTDANTTVELFGTNGYMTPGIVGSDRITGISGPGNVHMKMDTAGTTFNLQRLTDYTGRTILERGIMVMSSFVVTPESRAATTLGVTPGTYYGSLPETTVVEIGSDATLRLNASFAQTLGGITGYNGTSGTVDVNGSTLTINSATDSTFSGSLQGNGQLIKDGSGRFTFDGSSTFTGAITVNDGTLQIDATMGNTPVSINDGGTLAGSGTIGGWVSVASGGALAPSSSPGTLTIGGDLVFDAGAKIFFELGSDGSDLIAFNGFDQTLVSSGEILWYFTANGDIQTDAPYLLMDWSQATGFDSFYFLLEDQVIAGDGWFGSFAFTETGLTISFEAIPEPTTVAATLGLIALAVTIIRRRHR